MMFLRMKTVCALLALTGCVFAAENTLTPEEKKAGYKLLFDGKTMKNWRDPAKQIVPGDAWKIEDGTLTTVSKPHIEEDLLTEKSYGDFELKFDWKISPGGNTGLKYRIQREIFFISPAERLGAGSFEALIGRTIKNPPDRKALKPDQKGAVYTVAFEFQLIDDERHRDAQRGALYQTGALYSMIPAKAKAAKPAGEWNSSLLRLKGDHFEHWVNGTKVLEGSLTDPTIAAGAEKRWGKSAPEVSDLLSSPKRQGPFSLQHHGDPVWFRNIKIHELKK